MYSGPKGENLAPRGGHSGAIWPKTVQNAEKPEKSQKIGQNTP